MAHDTPLDDARGPAPIWLGEDAGLSRREGEVLALCARGLTNQEIADALYVNLETVKSHLKNVYRRFGLRNRAAAVAFAHDLASSNVPFVAAAAAGGREHLGDPDRRLVEAFDTSAITGRLALVGLEPEALDRLSVVADVVEANAAEFVALLVRRWLSVEEIAGGLVESSVLDRLVEHQRRYLRELFGGRLSAGHVQMMLRTGATHHRLRIPPEWYIASCSHVICEHVPLVFASVPDAIDAADLVSTLVASVLFDAGVVLDAYEFSANEAIVRTEAADATPPIRSSGENPAASLGRRPAGMLTQRPTKTSEAQARAMFIGIDGVTIETLRDLSGRVSSAVPHMLSGFYSLLGRMEATADLVPPSVVDRLMDQVGRYWHEATTTPFDAARGASRRRIGVIHEQIGVSPQEYLAGLARQITDLLQSVARGGSLTADGVVALVRSAMFDTTFILDAYLEARAQTVMRAGEFAGQIMSGMASGVVLVDDKNRVQYANEQLLDMIAIRPGLLHRMSVRDALLIPGVVDLVERARQSTSGRSVTVHRSAGRTLRIAAVKVPRSSEDDDPLVGIVIDDVSDAVDAVDRLSRVSDRSDRVLAAVGALAWEIDAETLTTISISGNAEAFTGMPAARLLGRPLLLDAIAQADRARFVKAARALSEGEQTTIGHRIDHPRRGVRWVQSSLVATTTESVRTISGVTVDVSEYRSAVDDRMARFASRVADAAHEIMNDLRMATSGSDATSAADPVAQTGPAPMASESAAALVQALNQLILLAEAEVPLRPNMP